MSGGTMPWQRPDRLRLEALVHRQGRHEWVVLAAGSREAVERRIGKANRLMRERNGRWGAVAGLRTEPYPAG